MVDFKVRIQAGKVYENSRIRKEYLLQVPRFNVDGMNQAEFIQYVFIIGFMRGAEWQKQRE